MKYRNKLINFIYVFVFSFFIVSCGDDSEEIPTVEELESMTKNQGSEEFKKFMTMLDEYEKSIRNSE